MAVLGTLHALLQDTPGVIRGHSDDLEIDVDDEDAVELRSMVDGASHSCGARVRQGGRRDENGDIRCAPAYATLEVGGGRVGRAGVVRIIDSGNGNTVHPGGRVSLVAHKDAALTDGAADEEA